jgi:PAS domain S-box-containing protein
MPTHYEAWLRSVHPADRESAEQAIFGAIARRSPEYRAEYRILLPSGAERWLDAIGKVDYTADGTPTRLSGINLDITRRKRAELALRKAKEFHRQKSEELETILAAVPTALIIAKGADCIEMAGNSAAYDLLRVSPHMELSKSAPGERAPTNFEVFSNGCNLLAHELPIQRAAAERRTIFGQELELRFDEGDAKFILSNALPLFDDMGEVRGAVGAFADITNLKRTEAALRESEKRLKFALEAAGAGTWEVTLETGELVASDRALSFLGIAPGTQISHEIALARVHPDDRSRLEGALRYTLDTGVPFRLEWRVSHADGSVRWMEARGERRSVSDKQVVAGLVLDITERKRAEEALRESEELLRCIIEHAPVPIMLSREDRKILLINQL